MYRLSPRRLAARRVAAGIFLVVYGRLMMLSKMLRAACDDEAAMREYLNRAEQEDAL